MSKYLPHVIVATLLVIGPGAIAWWVMQPEPTNASTAVVEAAAPAAGAATAPAAGAALAPEAGAATNKPATGRSPAPPTTSGREATTSKAGKRTVTLLQAQNAPHALAQLSVAQRNSPELPVAADAPPVDVPPVLPAKSEDIRVVTYAAGNADVTPPTVVSMPWLNPPPPDSEPYDAAIQVVVNEQGTVDSVKATIAPRTIGESIWVTNALSAMKAWRFQPAAKNGQPVRFRLIVPLQAAR